MRRATLALFVLAAVLTAASGSISGILKDPSGAVIQNARLTLVETGVHARYSTVSDPQGFYSFPVLPVGHYDLTIEAAGFKTQHKSNLAVDADAALRIDSTLRIGPQSETLTVTDNQAALQTQVDTVSTHLGEVISGGQIEEIPLNGRSYTDLLAIQPGVSPVTTLDAHFGDYGRSYGNINPSGDLDPGDVSIDGPARIFQRIYGERHRRSGAHERRNVRHPRTSIPSSSFAC